jgi:hypothetical protein
MRHRCILCFGLIMAGQQATAAECPVVEWNDVVITYRSSRPATVSGFVMTWVVLQGSKNGKSLELHMPYISKKQFIPKVGARCNLRYHLEKPIYSADSLDIMKSERKVIDNIACDRGQLRLR